MQQIRRDKVQTPENGSAMVLAIFVLVLVASMGIALLFLTHNETKMSQTDVLAKRAFYFAEAGQENGRAELFDTNGYGTFSDDLDDAAALDDTLSFNPAAVGASYDSNGNFTGFTGVGDDDPLVATTAVDDGWYAAYLTNDPAEGLNNQTDINRQVMITGVSAGPDRSFEVVQAIVAYTPLIQSTPPSTITILGPAPTFQGGTSAAKLYTGDDCTDPTVAVPVVGVTGASAETLAEAGISQPNTFVSGGSTGAATVEDIDASIDPEWKQCEYWRDRALQVKTFADLVGDTSTPLGNLGAPGAPKAVYIEGDYVLSGNFSGSGLLWVTGNLEISGMASWYGSIYVVGKGGFLRNGGGDGFTDGNVVVANIAGPDETMWTSDDCSGPDGLPGTSDDGIVSGSYINNGTGTHGTRFCLDAIDQTMPSAPYEILSFLQR